MYLLPSMTISRKILSDPLNKWLFSVSGLKIYLVGGYIRDILLGKSAADRDYVIKGSAEEIARHMADKFKGTFFQFKSKGTHRVVLHNGSCLDFTEVKGDITEDLSLRDFTVNAIAWSPSQGIIAHPSHLLDLTNRFVKVVDPQNLRDDPLRVLRAYRIASQLEFTIVPQTRRYLREYAPALRNTASERITDEIFKMFDHELSLYYLQLAIQDNVFSHVLPLTHGKISVIRQLKHFNFLLQRIKTLPNGKTILNHLESELSQGLTRSGLLRLYIFIRNTSQIKKSKDEWNDTSYGRLAVSREIKKTIARIALAEKLCYWRISDSRLYEIFRIAYPNTYETACIISLLKGRGIKRYFAKATAFNRHREKPLLNGNDVMQHSNITEGVFVGYIIDVIQRMRFTNKLKDRQSALKWIKANLT
jgi:tRNA nucleotidyltransferase/poly(A) polymerase